MKKIEAFVIHLKRATNRYAQVQALVNKLAIKTEIVQAIDGEHTAHHDLQKHYSRRLFKPHYPFLLNTGEIACFLSHRSVWKLIVDRDLDGAFIFEDDAGIDGDFARAMDVVMGIAEQGNYIRFPVRMKEVGEILHTNGHINVLRPNVIGLKTMAQFVSRQSAIQLLQMTEQFDRPVDTFLQMRWVHQLHVLTVSPSGVLEGLQEQSASTIQRKKSLGQKLIREILRPVYRGQVRYRSAKAVRD